jgi:hypothetical protein
MGDFARQMFMNKQFRVVFFSLGFFLAGWPAAASAQNSRAEIIAEAQAEKARALAAETPSATERFITFATRPRTSAFYPWLGKAYRGSGLTVGLGYDRRLPAGGGLNIVGGGNQRGSWLGRADIHLRPLDDPRQLRLVASESRANGLAFFGVGTGTTKDDRSTYDVRQREARLEVGLPLAAGVTFVGAAGYHGVTTFDAPVAVNIDQRIDYLRVSTGLRADWRPAPGYATRGGSARVDFIRRFAGNDDRASFDEIEAEITQLIPFVSEQFTFAFRALATTTRVNDDHTVPFFFLPYVGSGNTLRGFANNRFKDRSRLVLSGEYRWRASRIIDMALFVDHGAVGPALTDLDRDAFRTAWGAGMRFHTPIRTVFRFDVAKSREGIRLVFSTSQPF